MTILKMKFSGRVFLLDIADETAKLLREVALQKGITTTKLGQEIWETKHQLSDDSIMSYLKSQACSK